MFDLGQKVVCVDDAFPPGINDIFNSLPVKGRAYTVRDIVPGQDWDLNGTCAVMLAECVNRPNGHGIEPGFAPHRFREIESGFDYNFAECAETLTLTNCRCVITHPNGDA